jgi:hypothetical protein
MDPPRKRTISEAYQSFSVEARRDCLARAINRIKSRVRHFEFRKNRRFERAEAYISAAWDHLSGNPENPAPVFTIESADQLVALLVKDATFQIWTEIHERKRDSNGRTELRSALGPGGYARPGPENQRDAVVARAYLSLKTKLGQGGGRRSELALGVLDLVISAAQNGTLGDYIDNVDTERRKRPDGTKKQVRLGTPKLGFNVNAIAASLEIRPDYASKVLRYLRRSMAAVGGPTFFRLLWDLSEPGELEPEDSSEQTAPAVGASMRAEWVLGDAEAILSHGSDGIIEVLERSCYVGLDVVLMEVVRQAQQAELLVVGHSCVVRLIMRLASQVL